MSREQPRIRSANAETSGDPRIGLKIAVADVNEDGLLQTGAEVAKIVGEANVLVVPTNVSKLDDVVRLRDKVYEAWGEVS